MTIGTFDEAAEADVVVFLAVPGSLSALVESLEERLTGRSLQ